MNSGYLYCEYNDYFEKCTIQFPIPHKKILFLFDIDGVVCEALPYQIERSLTTEEYNKLISVRKCLPIFLNTIHKIDNERDIENYHIMFLTGRKIFSKNETETMFKDGGLGYLTDMIIYYPMDLKWYSEDYINHKTIIIRKLLDNKLMGFDYIYFFDDNEPLMTQLHETFKQESRIKLFLIKKG